jgi:hypothetical protein
MGWRISKVMMITSLFFVGGGRENSDQKRKDTEEVKMERPE